MGARDKVMSCFQRTGKFIFNTETKEIFGRTCISWTQIVSFFVVFYIVVGGIFMAHLFAFIAITPSPGEGVQPWNYGKYAYPNYPNSKIDLVAVPKSFLVKGSEFIVANHDKKLIEAMVQSAGDSGVSSHCRNESSMYGYLTGEPCIFLHIARVFNWEPQYISGVADNATFLPIACSVESQVDGLADNVSITAQPSGIPLTLANNNDTGSFPFRGQSDFITPMMAVSLDFNGVNVDKFKASVTCGVDFDAIGVTKPDNDVLRRLYEIPKDTSTKITFKPS